MEASRDLVTQTYKEISLPAPSITTEKYKSLSEPAAELLAQGFTLKSAAFELGIHWNTLEYWAKNDVHFCALLEYKRDQYRKKFLDRIDEAGNKTWFANAWILERNKAFKGEFAQPKAAAAGSGNIQINVVVGTSPAGSGGTTVTVGAAPDEGE